MSLASKDNDVIVTLIQLLLLFNVLLDCNLRRNLYEFVRFDALNTSEKPVIVRRRLLAILET